VRLVKAKTRVLQGEWRPKSGRNISVANCNNQQVVCAVGSELYYLTIEDGSIKEVR